MTIDWESISRINLENISDDQAESLYDQLIEYVPNGGESMEQLKRLFMVCKMVMQVKALQADVALDEMERITSGYSKAQVEQTMKELEVYKQAEAEGNSISNKLKEFVNENLSLKNKISSLENSIVKFKSKMQELQNNLEIREKENFAFKAEINSLREELDNQRSFDEQISERQEPVEQLREKNKLIQRLLNETKEMETINLELAKQLKQTKMELKTATDEMDLTTNQMEMIRAQFDELKSANEELSKANNYYEKEIDEMRKKISKNDKDNEKIFSKIEEKTQYFQQMISQKNEEILQLKSNSLNINLVDNQTHTRCRQVIVEREKEIETLKSTLAQCVKDMDKQTELMQQLMKKEESKNGENQVQLNRKIQEYQTKLKSVEEEIETKDQELLNLKKRINLYEKENFGLNDAMKQVNDLEKQLVNRQNKVEEMIQQVNHLNLQLSDAVDEIEALKGGKTDSNIFTSTNEFRRNVRGDKLKVLELQQEVLKLEEEKISLHEEIRNFKNNLSRKKKDHEIDDLNSKIKELKAENENLHIGMKEILNGIKECDSKSAVIIECPSLERLCQIYESRHFSGDLSTIIVLKAELDLIRGQNDELRMEMKRLRNDQFALIAEYTQLVLSCESYVSKEEEEEEVIISEEKGEEFEGELNLNLDKEEGEEKNKTETDNEYDSVAEIKVEFIDQETQTFVEEKLEIKNENLVNEKTMCFDKEIQVTSEGETLHKIKCPNCERILKLFESIKKCVDQLKDNIKISEGKYIQQIELLQTQNKNLENSLNEKIKEKDKIISQKEEQIFSLKSKEISIKTTTNNEESSISEEKSSSDEPEQDKVSTSCTSVLNSVIKCLQARIEHKDESIKNYQNILKETKENFESEMKRLIESHQEDNRRQEVRFEQLIDNEELQSALHNCVSELESCKMELNSKVAKLESELESTKVKLKLTETENEQLKLKRFNPNLQLKKEIESLKAQIVEKDAVIETLNKTIRSERMMRISLTKRKQKQDSTGQQVVSTANQLKIGEENDKDFTNLRAEIASLKKINTELEVSKWELEKRIKELSEQHKLKLKEKIVELTNLEKNYEKSKTLTIKYENEIHILQTKLNKLTSTPKKVAFSKSIQSDFDDESRRLRNQFKKISGEKQSLEIKIKELQEKLEKQNEIEQEMKTLLQESLEREKLATIYEEKLDLDKQYENLLQENAQLKIELRMTEFELKKMKSVITKS